MGRFLAHWLTTAAGLGVCSWILPGVHVRSIPALLVAGLVLGFVNAIIKPVLFVLTLPITILTLGLFYLVVNGTAFGLAAAHEPGCLAIIELRTRREARPQQEVEPASVRSRYPHQHPSRAIPQQASFSG